MTSIIDYEYTFSTDAECHSQEEAEKGALADYKSVLGKLVRVSEVYVYTNDKDYMAQAHEGRSFVVRVDNTNQRAITNHWSDDNYLDPYWDVTVIEGADMLPEGARSHWIYGRTWKVVSAMSEG